MATLSIYWFFSLLGFVAALIATWATRRYPVWRWVCASLIVICLLLVAWFSHQITVRQMALDASRPSFTALHLLTATVH